MPSSAVISARYNKRAILVIDSHDISTLSPVLKLSEVLEMPCKTIRPPDLEGKCTIIRN